MSGSITEEWSEQPAAHEAESESWTMIRVAEAAATAMTTRTEARLKRTRQWIGGKAGRELAEARRRC
jgi:hypothetical protein